MQDAGSQVRSLRPSTDLMRIVLTLFALIAPTFLSAQELPASDPRVLPPAIAACVDALDPPVVGVEKLDEKCPGLKAALTEAGLDTYLSEEQRAALTTNGLNDLEQLAQHFSATAPAAAVLSPNTLEPILDQLRKPAQADVPLSWFEKFKRWLRGLIAQNDQSRDSWLSRWLDDVDVPQAVTRWILYGAIALIIGLAIAVVINELRANGVLQGRSMRTRNARRSGETTEAATLADLDALGVRDRPAALLQRLVHTLVRSGRLRAERSLTHRELGARAQFDASEQRRRFEQVALLGERLVYGNLAVSDEDIDRVIRDGRALERELELTPEQRLEHREVAS